ncbi:uncharacterized protein LOC124544909 isoform X1 [Schistocerca americana]|uniref:uncharacterized protein LOC124544909 isoform X1 n=1 Tax=Schistocerca americana TaxID=7009 RepID=UPI001F4F6BB2|nr:uncharacterized protein LOC124544909 isoform X1 [Schistocerca americana]
MVLAITSFFSTFKKEFHTPCNGLIFNCTWNGITFHCCEQFLPLDTEIGLCFAINSWQTNHLRYNASPLNMISDANTGPGRLYFEIGAPVMVYVLATQEVPTINTPEYRYFFMKPGRQVQHRYSVKEVENDQAVHELTIKQRHCRFHYENYDNGLYPYYAYSVCITECRKKAQLHLCNCASHQLPNNKRVCNLSGIVCINDHHAYLSILRNKESSKNALLCTCEQSCEDQLITRTYGTIRMLKSQHGALEISLQSLPYERLKRTVVRSHLDMCIQELLLVCWLELACSALLKFCITSQYASTGLFTKEHSRNKNKETKSTNNVGQRSTSFSA